MSELTSVLKQLEQERARLTSELRQLDQAIQALTKIDNGPGRARGMKHTQRPRRALSVAARKRIAAAQRARWAKFRASHGKAA